MKNKKYLEKMRVLEAFQNPYCSSEGYVILEGENKKINCFVDEWLGDKEFRNGETIYVRLGLLPFNIVKINFPKKEVIPKIETNHHYILRGKIVDIIKEYNGDILAIIDCGFYVYVRLYKRYDFKKCDYIQVYGRLDAYKENECGIVKKGS